MWLVDNGLLEPADEPDLTNPDQNIIAAGGQIYVAVENGVVIGTCAIVPDLPEEFEVVKLAVTPSAQGRGVGRRLVEACLVFAQQHGARRVTLLSSSKLAPALKLYERVGFRYAPLPATNPYATADVYMVLDVESWQPHG